eukprot:15444044-Alexandrium_andersonii.AAC.1
MDARGHSGKACCVVTDFSGGHPLPSRAVATAACAPALPTRAVSIPTEMAAPTPNAPVLGGLPHGGAAAAIPGGGTARGLMDVEEN